jgi:hypothetical protein
MQFDDIVAQHYNNVALLLKQNTATFTIINCTA